MDLAVIDQARLNFNPKRPKIKILLFQIIS
jgi:hypothetical protein